MIFVIRHCNCNQQSIIHMTGCIIIVNSKEYCKYRPNSLKFTKIAHVFKYLICTSLFPTYNHLTYQVQKTAGTLDLIQKGLMYLHGQMNAYRSQPYVLAIITYALHVCDSGRKDDAFTLLDNLAITTSKTIKILMFGQYMLHSFCYTW